jgi:hypothetical protein
MYVPGEALASPRAERSGRAALTGRIYCWIWFVVVGLVALGVALRGGAGAGTALTTGLWLAGAGLLGLILSRTWLLRGRAAAAWGVAAGVAFSAAGAVGIAAAFRVAAVAPAAGVVARAGLSLAGLYPVVYPCLGIMALYNGTALRRLVDARTLHYALWFLLLGIVPLVPVLRGGLGANAPLTAETLWLTGAGLMGLLVGTPEVWQGRLARPYDIAVGLAFTAAGSLGVLAGLGVNTLGATGAVGGVGLALSAPDPLVGLLYPVVCLYLGLTSLRAGLEEDV